ncbi:hypothetical protein A9404_00190 [Halothiobacillus diazotrophicus]|uniref:Uncharacterized protein n=1 Tax=Halothiobacillus diazotrophicus TaxID=1860122 RepID=A0A191ZDR6_9GAMM|nr:bifunctional protein-serine/threonine kinase/phosphatase [Halothiobacillus diazotrophicus]ANJ66010.1 hypothetical protein A9404_00190 [Halothiobacillus diazotrophicus]
MTDIETPGLQVDFGFATDPGRRGENQDFVGAVIPNEPALSLRGATFCVADGVGGHAGGRIAAELTVGNFLEGFYALADTLGIEALAARSLGAINSWIHAQGRQDPNLSGMATTFTALILRGRNLHVVHIGDSRAYLLQAGHCEILTEDHTLKQPDLQHVLYRAVGLEEQIRVDHQTRELQVNDRLLLCSDGVHGALSTETLRDLLASGTEPQVLSERIVAEALRQGSQDNVTALVVHIRGLPATDRHHLETTFGLLPIKEPPAAGEIIDGFQLIRTISNGRYSRLMLAQETDAAEKQPRPVVLKFPQPRVASDREYRAAFVREALIGSRVHSPWIAEIITLPRARQSCLYSVMPYYTGQTLSAFIEQQHPIGLTTGGRIGVQLAKALYALHRQRIIHRDIKPENVLLLENRELKLLDLGVARLPGWEDRNDPALVNAIPGTPSFMAPEQFDGERGNTATDVYALAVTLFYLFTRSYPYGEIEPFSHPRFAKRKSLCTLRPDLPLWLDHLLDKALSTDPAERPQDSMEFAFELEQGLSGQAQGLPPARPLLQRNPVRFWQLVSLFLFICLMLSLWGLTHA